MTREDKIKNIFAFLCILFGEDADCCNAIINMSPDYIIEKFERYVLSEKEEWAWGLHPLTKSRIFDEYFRHWRIAPGPYGGVLKEKENERKDLHDDALKMSNLLGFVVGSLVLIVEEEELSDKLRVMLKHLLDKLVTNINAIIYE